MRKYWHIKVNPKQVTQEEYKMIRAGLPYPNLYILEFVFDVDKVEKKEIDSEEFNKLLEN